MNEIFEVHVRQEAIVNVTTDREAHPKRWVAALVRMCTEKKVSDRLTALQVENYVPIQTEIRQWSDRKKKVDRIVIPMVVFVRVDENDIRTLRTYSFIYKFISYPGTSEPAVIPEEQMERLKFMLHHADSPVEMNEHIEVGDKVRIARGPLKGLEGELCCVKAAQTLVAVRIESLGFACVNVSRADIETIVE